MGRNSGQWLGGFRCAAEFLSRGLALASAVAMVLSAAGASAEPVKAGGSAGAARRVAARGAELLSAAPPSESARKARAIRRQLQTLRRELAETMAGRHSREDRARLMARDPRGTERRRMFRQELADAPLGPEPRARLLDLATRVEQLASRQPPEPTDYQQLLEAVEEALDSPNRPVPLLLRVTVVGEGE